MKIIQINEVYGSGTSTGRTTMEMHRYLMTHGIDSHVFTCEKAVTDQGVSNFGNPLGRKVHALLSRLTGRQAHFSRWSTRALLQNVRRQKPDVVVLRIMHGNTVHYPLLLRSLSKAGCAVVLVLHDCWFFTGHCWYYTKANCEKWKTDCRGCPALDAGNKTWFFDRAAQDLAEKKRLYQSMPGGKLCVVGVSHWIAEEARQSILCGNEIRAIYNWIDQTVFCPCDAAALKDKNGWSGPIIFGAASFWTADKGWQEMLQAAERWPEATLVLAGSVPPNQELPPNIVCLGTVRNDKRMAEYYSMADVFLNPSRQETFGKTTAEAFSCGTPVVAYDTTACSELVSAERGQLVALGDMEALFAAVDTVLRNGKPFYRDACLAFAQDNFSYERNMEEYVQLFADLARKKQ